MTVVIRSSESQ